MLPCLSLSFQSPLPLLPQIPQLLYFTLTYQDSGDDVSPVLQAISFVAASHEAGSSHVLFIFIPVADLRHGQYVTKQPAFTAKSEI